MEPMLDPEYRDLEEALLRAGRDVSMSAELQAKTLQAVGLAAAGAGTAAATKAGFFGSKAGALWTAGLVGAAGLIGTYAVTSGENESPTTSSQVTQSSSGESVAAPSADTTHETAVIEQVDEPQAAPEPESPSAKADEPAPATTIAPKQSPRHNTNPQLQSLGLRDELSHIARVEAALKAGNYSQALTLLGEYKTRFSRPQLGLEAEVLTIQAMYRSGSQAAAQKRAQRFLEKHPKSPLGAQVKLYLK